MYCPFTKTDQKKKYNTEWKQPSQIRVNNAQVPYIGSYSTTVYSYLQWCFIKQNNKKMVALPKRFWNFFSFFSFFKTPLS